MLNVGGLLLTMLISEVFMILKSNLLDFTFKIDDFGSLESMSEKELIY